MREQRRGRVIAMSAEEMGSFLAEQRTCRFATSGPDGPHVSPVWFVWDGQALWVYSLIRSQRWANVSRDPRVAVVADDGHHYHELRGVEIEGEAAVVGPVPRPVGEALPELALPELALPELALPELALPELALPELALPELAEPERLMAEKYFGPASMIHDGRHAWLRITPNKVVSWDFRKLASLPDRDPNEMETR
ncbi:MAG TPA: pyridoxamine 5'-phosphate oxidase family protein [Streptosporangiaceae bacterium]